MPGSDLTSTQPLYVAIRRFPKDPGGLAAQVEQEVRDWKNLSDPSGGVHGVLARTTGHLEANEPGRAAASLGELAVHVAANADHHVKALLLGVAAGRLRDAKPGEPLTPVPQAALLAVDALTRAPSPLAWAVHREASRYEDLPEAELNALVHRTAQQSAGAAGNRYALRAVSANQLERIGGNLLASLRDGVDAPTAVEADAFRALLAFCASSVFQAADSVKGLEDGDTREAAQRRAQRFDPAFTDFWSRFEWQQQPSGGELAKTLDGRGTVTLGNDALYLDYLDPRGFEAVRHSVQQMTQLWHAGRFGPQADYGEGGCRFIFSELSERSTRGMLTLIDWLRGPRDVPPDFGPGDAKS